MRKKIKKKIKMPPTAIPKTMNYRYMILSESDTEKYTEFITRCCAPFEYTLLWKDLLEKHFSFHGFYLVCKDEHNLIQGVLPLFKAQGVGSSRLVSTPYAIYTGPVSEKEDIKLGLINFAQDVAQKENVDYVEIREKFPYTYPSQFSSRSKVFNFSLHLSSNPEDVWKKLPKSSVRWGVKKAEKSGLTWTSGNSQNDVDNFYSLFLQTRKFRGVPAYPYHYFKGIINSFPEKVKIYTAFYESKPVASIFLIYFHQEVRYAFAGAIHYPKFLQLQPYHLLIWESIKDACQKGYEVYNFGGATIDTNAGGLYEFKKKWADTIVEVHYYFYLVKAKDLPSLESSFALKVASHIWKKLPLVVIDKLSPYIIKK